MIVKINIKKKIVLFCTPGRDPCILKNQDENDTGKKS